MTYISLDAIGIEHGTDKSSIGHDYLNFYEGVFAPRRGLPLSILEIGVFNGASLRTWRDFFPHARVTGADIDPLARRWRSERIDVEYMDQSNLEDLVRVALKHGPFDIIIDDGSHFWEHQITTLKTLFPFLRGGGLYIVEDLQTNYGEMANEYRGAARQSCMDYLKLWLDLHVADTELPLKGVEDAFLRTYGRGALSLTFFKRACLIEKRTPPPPPGENMFQRLAPPPPDKQLEPIALMAHVSHVGDVLGPEGYVDLASDRYTFQGVAIENNGAAVEYRVRGEHGEWGAWTSAPAFAGTRGQARMITGAAFRLTEAAKGRFQLRTIGRFVATEGVAIVGDGEDCVAANGAVLVGLQVELAHIDAAG